MLVFEKEKNTFLCFKRQELLTIVDYDEEHYSQRWHYYWVVYLELVVPWTSFQRTLCSYVEQWIFSVITENISQCHGNTIHKLYASWLDKEFVNYFIFETKTLTGREIWLHLLVSEFARGSWQWFQIEYTESGHLYTYIKFLN